ncbi:hypothetical protein OURE66S_00652 [Oligella ureolytica]
MEIKALNTKALRKVFNVKNVSPASYELAHKWTGYEFGGTSPFGIRAISLSMQKVRFLRWIACLSMGVGAG